MLKHMAYFAALTVTLAVISPSADARHHGHHKGDKTADIIADTLLLGGLALAASSNDHRHENHPNYQPAPAPSMAPFSPTGGIVCYPGQASCYSNGGTFSPDWSYRMYGR